MKRIPMRHLFAPTLVANSSEEVGEADPFSTGNGGGSKLPSAAVEAAFEAAAEGASVREIKAAAIEEGATPAQAAVLAAKAEKAANKRGRKPGQKNRTKEEKKAAVSAARESKGHPASVGALPSAHGKRIPDDAYLVSMGRGTCAYSPSKRQRYKVDSGKIIHLGRKAEGKPASASTSKPASKPANKPASKPASAKTDAASKPAKKPAKLNDIASALALITQHLGKTGGVAKMPGLKITVTGDSAQSYAGKKRGRPAGGHNKPKADKAAEHAVDTAIQLAANGDRMRRLHRNGSDQPTKVGPYSISLLANPVTDFAVGGVKLVPAFIAAAGAVVMKNGFEAIPQIEADSNYKKYAPPVLTMAAAALVNWWAEKNGHKLVADISSDVFAFGLAFGTSAVLDQPIKDAISKAKSSMSSSAPAKSQTLAPQTPVSLPPPVSEPAKTGVSGGRFVEAPKMSGGAWANAPKTNGLNGYVTGKSIGYPQPDLSGGAPGYPPASLYGNGGANSAEISRAISPLLSGGQFQQVKKKVGIDMSGFAG